MSSVLTRKSYSTPVYLINIFEIGQVVLELGHFKDGVPKMKKSKKSKIACKNFHLENHCKIIWGSRKIEILDLKKFRCFRLFRPAAFKISDFRKFRFFQLLTKKFQKKVACKIFSSKISRKIFHKII